MPSSSERTGGRKRDAGVFAQKKGHTGRIRSEMEKDEHVNKGCRENMKRGKR